MVWKTSTQRPAPWLAKLERETGYFIKTTVLGGSSV